MKFAAACKRYWSRLYVKIVKERATPEYIARGWAIGMFYGCLIPFGFQLICSIPTSFLLKGSRIGATLGTLLTNHVTIFFIYPAQCLVGSRILGSSLGYHDIAFAMKELFEEQSYAALFRLGGDLVCAFFLGGAILTAVMTPLTYFAVKRMVASYRNARARRLARRTGADAK